MVTLATIKTALALYDGMTGPLRHITTAMNTVLSAFQSMQDTSGKAIDTSSLQQAREDLALAETAFNSLEESIRRVNETPVKPTVEQPAQMWSPTMQPQVFQASGLERYKQEAQSAAEMVNRLSAEQARLSIRAADTKLFPPNMAADMDAVYHRVSRVREGVEQMAKRKVGSLGAEQANGQMEALRQKMSAAIQEQNQLSAAMKRGDVSRACQSYERLDQIVAGLEGDIRQNDMAQNRFNQRLGEGDGKADSLWSKIKKIAVDIGGLSAVKQVLSISDQMSNTKARLNLLVDDGGSVAALEQKIMASAQRSRSAYFDTASAVAKLGQNAGAAFGHDNDQIIAFMEQVNKQFVIGGATAQEQSNAMVQLTQAMAAGSLRGEELNSILDGAPGIARAIEQYMGIAEGSIKEVAQEGKVTAEVVKNALFAMADETNEKFDSMPKTWGQIWTSMQNRALSAFSPILQKINDIANTPEFEQVADGLVSSLTAVSSILASILDAAVSAGSVIYDNWSVLEPIFWGLAAAVGGYAIALGIQTAATWIATGAAKAFFTTLLANPLIWIAIVIGVIIAVIAKWVKSVGGIRVAWLIVQNALYSIWDGLGIAFMTFVYGTMDLIGKIQMGFADMSTNIQNFLGDMKAGVLTILQDMVNGAIGIINGFIAQLNKIPGVSIEVIDDVSFGTAAQLQNEADKAARNATLTDYTARIEAEVAGRDAALNKMKLDAQAAAAERENNIALAKKAVVEVQPQDQAASGDPAGGIPDYLSDGVTQTADNTARMADALDITEEDMAYMRDIAEREAINRFTTAQISIEQHNENHLASGMDIDGIMENWCSSFAERLNVSAEGVYA